MATFLVIPAQAQIQEASVVSWTPAFAGVIQSPFYGVVCNRQDIFTHTPRLRQPGILLARPNEFAEPVVKGSEATELRASACVHE